LLAGRAPPPGPGGPSGGPVRFRGPPGPPALRVLVGPGHPRPPPRRIAGRRCLPPRCRHPGPHGGGARRALRGRADFFLRGAHVHLAPALPRGSGQAVMALAEFRSVSFAYPQGAGSPPPFELRELSFTLEPGEVLGLIGPNAAGKTTVIRLLSRVLQPSSGAIVIDGQPASALDRAEVARRIAVVPQDVPRGFPYTVEQLVLMG